MTLNNSVILRLFEYQGNFRFGDLFSFGEITVLVTVKF